MSQRKPILCPACGGVNRTPSGSELANLRRAAGATQADVARALGCVRPFVSLVETGRRDAPLRMLAYYAEHFESAPPPWWEPRECGSFGPSVCQHDRADLFDTGAGEWSEAEQVSGTWFWIDSGQRVDRASHWRPKGPAPGAAS